MRSQPTKRSMRSRRILRDSSRASKRKNADNESLSRASKRKNAESSVYKPLKGFLRGTSVICHGIDYVDCPCWEEDAPGLSGQGGTNHSPGIGRSRYLRTAAPLRHQGRGRRDRPHEMRTMKSIDLERN